MVNEGQISDAEMLISMLTDNLQQKPDRDVLNSFAGPRSVYNEVSAEAMLMNQCFEVYPHMTLSVTQVVNLNWLCRAEQFPCNNERPLKL